MLTYELFFYARTGMMSGIGRSAFNGKAGMQWAVDLVCKPAFMQVVSTARDGQPGDRVSLHKPLASSERVLVQLNMSYCIRSYCINLILHRNFIKSN